MYPTYYVAIFKRHTVKKQPLAVAANIMLVMFDELPTGSGYLQALLKTYIFVSGSLIKFISS